MKFCKIILVVGLALSAVSTFAAGTAAQLLTQKYSSYSTSATNNNAAGAVVSCTISANSANGGTPVVTALSAGNDTNTSTATTITGQVLFYKIIDQTVANYANTTVSIPVNATNSFISGDLCLIRHLTNDSYERITLTTVTSGTNLTAAAAPVQTVQIGDIIYKLGTNGAAAIPFASITNTYIGTGIVSGQKGLPLHMAMKGLNGCQINFVSARYDP